MRVLVIGSGLIGVATAYWLRRHGHDVTVLDREEGPGRETSFANGALLTPSMSEPWNSPGSWRVLLVSLGRSNAPMQLRMRALPGLVGWGIKFLRNSTPTTFRRNTLSNLRLALHSMSVLRALREETGIDYGCATRGTLRIFRDAAALDNAFNAALQLLDGAAPVRRLSPKEVVTLEPGIAPIERKLAGALHYESDETGNAYRFCVELTERARQLGVEFFFRTEVTSIQLRSGAVNAVSSGERHFSADRYVVAAGSYSPLLLRQIGLDLPVRPVKGYSLTFNNDNQTALRIPILDDQLHAAVVPLDGNIRVAGTAEFTGYDRSPNPARIRNLVSLLKQVLPEAHFDPQSGKPWCGLRPMSADGVPIIGATRIANLLVNTGHGPLGWTLAAGSGQLLADLVSGERPSIDPAPYSLRHR
jgi:D-amino-acid dehydrogenase